MTSAQVVETSVTNNSSSQNYTHPDDHTIRTTDTPGFKPYYDKVIMLRQRPPKPYKLLKRFMISVILLKMGKHMRFYRSFFQMVGKLRDFTVVTKLIKRDVCMDFEPCFKVHNLLSVHPNLKSMKLGKMTILNVTFHVGLSGLPIGQNLKLAPVPCAISEFTDSEVSIRFIDPAGK